MPRVGEAVSESVLRVPKPTSVRSNCSIRVSEMESTSFEIRASTSDGAVD